jgi:hypothetical protein
MDCKFFLGIAVAFAIVFFGAAFAQNLMKHPHPDSTTRRSTRSRLSTP